MRLVFSPPELFSQVSPPSRTERAIRTDMKCSFRPWEIDVALQVHFLRHVLTSAPRGGNPYCCAITSGEVQIHFPDCTVIECDGEQFIDVEVERNFEDELNNGSTFSPEVGVETPFGKGEAKIGSSNKATKNTIASKARFSTREAIISALQHTNGVCWLIRKGPRADLPFDYLYADFEFNVLLKGQRRDFNGSIKILPGSFSVYDSRGRYVSEKFTFRALLLSMMHGKRLSSLFVREYEISFREEGRD